jgi:NAD(P)-dependent dehydrogenase (short-subunit alcohol dehydrogenase family)
MNPEIRLDGHRVLVTGSARGLGESFVRALHQAGARVAISDVLHERGRALAQELGEGTCYVPMDLMDPQAIEAGVAEAARLLGDLGRAEAVVLEQRVLGAVLVREHVGDAQALEQGRALEGVLGEDLADHRLMAGVAFSPGVDGDGPAVPALPIARFDRFQAEGDEGSPWLPKRNGVDRGRSLVRAAVDNGNELRGVPGPWLPGAGEA